MNKPRALRASMDDEEVPGRLLKILRKMKTNFLICNNNEHYEQIPVGSLAGKIVGLYFAGSWYLASQSFTPQLVGLYKQVGTMEINKFEVVYISCDFIEESFDEYYSQMPWPAVPFSDSKTRAELRNLFGFKKFPTLVILDEYLGVRSYNATDIVWDYGPEAFPFTYERIKFLKDRDRRVNRGRTVSSLLDSTNYLISKDGKQVQVSEIENKMVGLYFWKKSDGNCFRFHKFLLKAYGTLRHKHKFEVVLIPQDQSETQYGEEFADMPWLAMPFTEENINKAEKLTLNFKLENLPGLVIIRPNGKISITNAVELITKHGIRAFPFTPYLAEFHELDKQRHEAEALYSLLASESEDIVMGNNGSHKRVSKLVGHILFYFSAEHFTESETFLEQLMKTYYELRGKKLNIEVIFVSLDRDIDKSVRYFTKMPWYALPYESKMRSVLIDRFNILEDGEHPKVVAIGPLGSSMTTKGVQMIKNFGADAYPFEEHETCCVARTYMMLDELRQERKLKSVNHEHELDLIHRESFSCSDCSRDGEGSFYCCEDCNFNLHKHCVRPLKDEDEANHDDHSKCINCVIM